ncbi:MAG: hypothetical protein NXY57DRAFT_1043624 [Lentinula lateritia]|nr:MAG: hypothetical protein NXY57DRAFT_1043624 [Lentinula lateritia]
MSGEEIIGTDLASHTTLLQRQLTHFHYPFHWSPQILEIHPISSSVPFSATTTTIGASSAKSLSQPYIPPTLEQHSELRHQTPPPRPSSPLKLLWNPAVEPPPNTAPPPSAFPSDTYFQNIWDQTPSKQHDCTHLHTHHTISPTLDSGAFFEPPPPSHIPERIQDCYKNVIGDIHHDPSAAPNPNLKKVKHVFPWEDKPCSKSGRVLPASDAPPAELFTSLMVAEEPESTFPNSFSTDQAAQNLASLKFSQSNRGPDPREPSRAVTTTTTTTFSMTQDMAKAMSQHFLDARLIENAADPSSNLFKDRGIYILRPKGLHNIFIAQPICVKLLHLERRSADDEIIANYPSQTTQPQDAFQRYNERARGVFLMDVTEHAQLLLGKGQQHHKYCFAAETALEWLCDFASVVGREEAAEMAAQFIRFGLITLVSDKRKNNDSAIIFTVRGSAPGGNLPVSQPATYKIMDEGHRVTHWDGSRPLGAHDSPNASSASLNAERSSVDNVSESGEKKGSDAKIHRRISMAKKKNTKVEERFVGKLWWKSKKKEYQVHGVQSISPEMWEQVSILVDSPKVSNASKLWQDQKIRIRRK